MGREVRMVPANWEHPKSNGETYIPLYEHFQSALDEFKDDVEKMGRNDALEYHGGEPNPEDYMPNWTVEEATHYQMYEDVSEGTPISPPMETPEKLAQWLVDNNASSFAGRGATYEQWLRVCNGGFAPSAVITGTGCLSGVEALTDED